MSKIKLLTIAVIGLLFVNLGIIGFLFFRKPAQHPKGRPPMEQGGPKNIIIERLGFDKEQTGQYEDLIEQHQKAIRTLNDSIKIAKNNLYQSLTDEKNAGKDTLIAKLSLLQRKIELTHYDHFASMRTLCKPDQLAAFNNLTKELARFFGHPKKKGPPAED